MKLRYGDIISIDNDHWDLIQRRFKVISAKYNEESTSVKLVIEDLINEEILVTVVAENQIVREINEVD